MTFTSNGLALRYVRHVLYLHLTCPLLSVLRAVCSRTLHGRQEYTYHSARPAPVLQARQLGRGKPMTCEGPRMTDGPLYGSRATNVARIASLSN